MKRRAMGFAGSLAIALLMLLLLGATSSSAAVIVVENVSPPTGSEVRDLTPTLEWKYSEPPSTAKVISEVQISPDPQWVQGVWQQTVDGGLTSLQVPAGVLKHQVTYFWHVRVNDGTGWSEYSYPWKFVTDNRPAVFTFSPTEGALIRTLTPNLQWNYVDADGDPQSNAEVEVSTDPAFGVLGRKWQTAITGNAESVQVPLGILADGVTYYWRVRAKDGMLWSNYSQSSFHTNGPPVTENSTPANGSVVLPNSPVTLGWTYSDPDGDSLARSEVQVATDLAFSVVAWQSTLTGNATTIQVPAGALQPGTVYYWRVRVSDGYLWSTLGLTRFRGQQYTWGAKSRKGGANGEESSSVSR